MPQSRLFPAALVLIFGSLTVLFAACSENKQTKKTESQPYPSMDHLAAIQPHTHPVQPQTTIKPSVSYPNVLSLALDRADSGLSISQWAESADDWRLVVTQFQDAIALMKQIPADSPNFPYAQRKIGEFRQSILLAKKQIQSSQFPETMTEPKPLEIIPPRKTLVKIPPPPYASKPLNKRLAHSISHPVYQPPKFPLLKHDVFITPIKRRIGGTPIIEVTFNGKQRFEMIVDTGASGTVITQQIANALGVVPVGKAKASTVNAKSVEFPVGYLDSIEVGGVVMNQVPVAIAGKELETGLLGHDFFGNYDVTIKRNTIEFRPQSNTETNFGETPPAVPTLSKGYHFLGSP